MGYITKAALLCLRACAGEIQVAVEYSAAGTVAKGSIDYVLMFCWCSIVVVQGKLHDELLKHSGQLAAAMKAAREQFCNTMLTKRKHEPEGDFSKVGKTVCALLPGCQAGLSGLADGLSQLIQCHTRAGAFSGHLVFGNIVHLFQA
jgi:hypothetical protein